MLERSGYQAAPLCAENTYISEQTDCSSYQPCVSQPAGGHPSTLSTSTAESVYSVLEAGDGRDGVDLFRANERVLTLFRAFGSDVITLAGKYMIPNGHHMSTGAVRQEQMFAFVRNARQSGCHRTAPRIPLLF